MATGGFPYDVFLSHSSQDKPVVRELAKRMQGDGLRIWFDEWEIKPGDSIPRKIDEGLDQSSVLVLCMSAASLGADWVTLESQAFRFTDPVNRNLRFIPLRLDDTAAKPSLRQFAYVDWRDGGSDEAYLRLLTACRRQGTPAILVPKRIEKSSESKLAGPTICILEGHSASVNAVAVTADGKRAISASNDKTLRVWDLDARRVVRVLTGHSGSILAVAVTPDGKRAISASSDTTLRVWDLESDQTVRVLEGHSDWVRAVAITSDGKCAFSASDDNTLRIWDLEGEKPTRVIEDHFGWILAFATTADERLAALGSNDFALRILSFERDYSIRVFEGHLGWIRGVALAADGKRAVSASEDKTVRVWDLSGNQSTRVLEGHSGSVKAVAVTTDGMRAVSCSEDKTLRVWDLDGGQPVHVLEGHLGPVNAVALSADGKLAVSASFDRTLRVWDLDSLRQGISEEQIRYSNAKVVLVGDSGSGKTGITVRLAHDLPPSRWPSTSGVWSTQWPLKDLPVETGWEQELWLWDFGGQADQRLIHQLYLDHTSAVLLLFDGDRDVVLPGLREWQHALARSIASSVPVLLLAGRTDVGSRFDRARVQAFARASGYQFFETSAETNRGIPEVREALLKAVPWGSLERHESPTRFKRLKDEILRIRDEGGVALATFKELESLLTGKLDAGFSFASSELRTVISLLDGPGIVKELNFGSYVLLRPEWINIYAQAVIRTLRASENGLGYMPVRAIRAGELIFLPGPGDGQSGEERRLRPEDEQIVLQSMESVLLARRLCLLQDGDLVFPSYCGRERPMGPAPPKYFVSYGIDGFLDDIYATLVVKLAHCGAFSLKDLWRDAADFETLADKKLIGVRLQRNEEGGGEILAHHAQGVVGEEQVIFASYIDQHLVERSTSKVQRLRHYICPHCGEPVENRRLAMERLLARGEEAEILCPACEKYVTLWDRLEELFADADIRQQVQALRSLESFDLDSRRLGKLLVHEASARILSADQKCVEVPQDLDEGIDLEVEFTEQGRGTGKRMYLQLKAGNSHLKIREKDGAQIFRIRKQSWVDYWVKTSVNGPVMLVIGTLSDSKHVGVNSDNNAFADVRWMEIGQLLREQRTRGIKIINQLEFKGERLDARSVLRWRDRVLNGR